MPLDTGTKATCRQVAAPSVVRQIAVPAAWHCVSGDPPVEYHPLFRSANETSGRTPPLVGGSERSCHELPRSVDRKRTVLATSTQMSSFDTLSWADVGIGIGRVGTLTGFEGLSELGASAGRATSTAPMVAMLRAATTPSTLNRSALIPLFNTEFYVGAGDSVTRIRGRPGEDGGASSRRARQRAVFLKPNTRSSYWACNSNS